MTSRDYTIFSVLYTAAIFGFACLMQWASFMESFRDWCNQHDNVTGMILVGMCLPLAYLMYAGTKAWQHEKHLEN
jgi:hypothetical protein